MTFATSLRNKFQALTTRTRRANQAGTPQRPEVARPTTPPPPAGQLRRANEPQQVPYDRFDLSKPYVCLRLAESYWDSIYRPGDIVYPKTSQPGSGFSVGGPRKDYTPAKLEPDTEAVTLDELLRDKGTNLNISADFKGQDVRFFRDGRPENADTALLQLASAYAQDHVPEAIRNLGKASAVRSVETSQNVAGIYCPNVDAVENLLAAYAGAPVKGDLQAVLNPAMNELPESIRGDAKERLAAKLRGREKAIVTEIVAAAHALESGRTEEFNYEYGGGNAFFKTTVTVNRKTDGFVVNLHALSDSAPEELREIGERLGYPAAVANAYAFLTLDPVADGWVVLDTQALNLPRLSHVSPQEQLQAFLGGSEEKSFDVTHADGLRANLSFRLGKGGWRLPKECYLLNDHTACIATDGKDIRLDVKCSRSYDVFVDADEKRQLTELADITKPKG